MFQIFNNKKRRKINIDQFKNSNYGRAFLLFGNYNLIGVYNYTDLCIFDTIKKIPIKRFSFNSVLYFSLVSSNVKYIIFNQIKTMKIFNFHYNRNKEKIFLSNKKVINILRSKNIYNLIELNKENFISIKLNYICVYNYSNAICTFKINLVHFISTIWYDIYNSNKNEKQFILLVFSTSSLLIYNINTKKCETIKLKLEFEISSLIFNKSNTHLFIGDYFGVIHEFETIQLVKYNKNNVGHDNNNNKRKKINEFIAHKGIVNNILFMIHYRYLLSYCKENITIKIWRIKTLPYACIYNLQYKTRIFDLIIDPIKNDLIILGNSKCSIIPCSNEFLRIDQLKEEYMKKQKHLLFRNLILFKNMYTNILITKL